MEKSFIHYIPILTTIFAFYFTINMFGHYQKKSKSRYLFWWMLGVFMYGVGTLTESLTTLFSWDLIVFKSWYISGALLGGALLAQGTVYLLHKPKIADRLTIILVTIIIVAAVSVAFSPVNMELVESHRLSGQVFSWQWVRLFSPFINLYAFIYLVGGAIWSAVQYHRLSEKSPRYYGNIFIAVGALLPGIGGSFTRFGFVEILYITEFLGLSLIWYGYTRIKMDKSASLHKNQNLVSNP